MENISSFAPVSVIIPCFNASLFLSRAVDSVVNQTLLPFQLVMVDDASTDGGKTRNLIANIEKYIASLNNGMSVKTIFLQKNVGPGGARNSGWNVSTQEWIAFLDADDSWAVNKLALQYGCLLVNKQIDVLAHRSSFKPSDLDGAEPVTLKGRLDIQRVSLLKMLVSNTLPTRSILLRREIPLRFPENILSEDYSLWLQIIAAGYDVRLMNCALAFAFRPEYSEGGSSAKLWTQERGELCAFLALYQGNSISFLTLLIASNWSILKFTKRFIIRTLHI